jgi:hypothetical protein
MTAPAFSAALVRRGLSHSQAAVFLGKNIRLIRDWGSGRKPIPLAIAARLWWPKIFNASNFPPAAVLGKLLAGDWAAYFALMEWLRWYVEHDLRLSGREHATIRFIGVNGKSQRIRVGIPPDEATAEPRNPILASLERIAVGPGNKMGK